MSGRSARDAIYLADEETPEQDLEHEFDDQIYAPDSEDEDGDFDDNVEFSAPPTPTPPYSAPCPTKIEISKVELGSDIIRFNDVVELVGDSEKDPATLQSGDFLLVRAILEDWETGVFELRGYRLRRNRYYRPMFGSSSQEFNDLFLLLDVDIHKSISPWIQGLESVMLEEVLRKRKCVYSTMSPAAFGVRQVNPYRDPRSNKEYNDAQWAFHMGTLIVRHVHIRERERDGTPYGGVVRRLFKREIVEFSSEQSTQPLTRNADTYGVKAVPTSYQTRTRAQSVEVDESPRKRLDQLPKKNRVYRFGDCFCGTGGTSEGAQRAGWHVAFGLENDPLAMEAYRGNFPGALHFEMDAHDFPFVADKDEHGVDLIHFSCPCQFWSDAHSVEGKDDQKNMETIYVPDAVVAKLKPRLFSMEQAPGLIRLRKHQLHFRGLVGRLLSKNYNVRYKVQDQAWFGLPQHRRRLIFVGAKVGTPLPPMPKPVYGPAGSGLQRFKTIGDALRPLLRQELRINDEYHQPHLEPRTNARPTDPHTTIANCVTGSGGANVHYDGNRPYTPRELAYIQGLFFKFQFNGSRTNAKKQIGNVWSPTSAQHYFLTWAATLEAFDNQLIEAEDEIDDLYQFLEQKQVNFGKPPPIELDRYMLGGSHLTVKPKYRYISRLEKTVEPKVPLALWARRKDVEPRVLHSKKAKTSPRAGFDGCAEIDRLRNPSIAPRSVSVESQPSRSGSDRNRREKKRSRTGNPSGRDDKRFESQKRTKSDSELSSYKRIIYEISDDEE